MSEADQREIEFHDEWANSVDPKTVCVDAVGRAATMPETRYILKSLGNIEHKKILEVGCGCGEASIYFAKQGACVTAIDSSSGMIELTKKVAAVHNVQVDTIVCSAEELLFPDNSFDIVYAANVIHHIDMEKTLKEVKRVLVDGGVFVCWDPVKYNPAINIYRKLAKGVRTVDEHPIDKSYIACVNKHFNYCEQKGFWLTTCLVFVKYFFVDKVNPNKERYWKKIIDDSESLEKMYLPLEKTDAKLLKIFPWLRWMCWNMVIIAKN